MASYAFGNSALGITPFSGVAHPLYAYWAPIWRKLSDCYEGTGGFQDGTYLVAHPREWIDHTSEFPNKPSKKLKERRSLARYEPVAAAIVDGKRNALFREKVLRTVGKSDKATPHPIEEWWANVDGRGLGIDDWMSSTWPSAGVFGHVVYVMDRPKGGTATTAADEKAPYLSAYTPLDLVDWRERECDLVSVKLVELVTNDDILTPVPTSYTFRERYITETEWWTMVSGKREEGEKHGFGALPVVLCYGNRRTGDRVGRSVMGDPRLYIDLFNLTSELRELLRKQTFSVVNAPLGTGDNAVSADDAKNMLGTETGGTNVLFSPLPMQILSADTGNVEAYQNEIERLERRIYRTSATLWETDTKDAEAKGSLSLKREDMNQHLAALADNCEEAEYAIAKLWFRGTYGDSWEQQWEQAEVVIRYPDEFQPTPFEDLLMQAQAAQGLGYGPDTMAEIKKRLLAKFVPDAPQDVMDRLEKEAEAGAKADAEMEQRRKDGELKILETQGKVPPKTAKVAA